MPKETKKILEELYEISPELKSEKGLKSFITFLENHNPKIHPSKKFKETLRKKLTTIWEFKQIQTSSKSNFTQIIRPICFGVFGIFILFQFHNFLSLDSKNRVTNTAVHEENIVMSEDLNEWKIEIATLSGNLRVDENKNQEENLENFQNNENWWVPNNQWEWILGNKNDDKLSDFSQNSINKKQDISAIDNSEILSQAKMILKEQEEKQALLENLIEEREQADSENQAAFEKDKMIYEENKKIESSSTSTWWDDQEDEVWYEDKRSFEENYFVCEGEKLSYIDEEDMKRIIKMYCQNKWWNYDIEKYICKLNPKKWVWIDYIQRDLCQ